MSTSGIYCIIHRASRKVYIGQSSNVESRLRRHKSWMASPTRVINRCFNNYAKKYSVDDFDFTVIEQCEKDRLDEREMFWYQVFKPNTFNSRPNPVTNRGCKRTAEACIANRAMLKNLYSNSETRKLHAEKIKAAMANPSVRAKISTAASKRTGRVVKQGQVDRAKITNFLRGNSNCVGQYSKEMQLVDFHLNVEDAAKSIGKSRGNIASNLTGKLKSAYGYIWKYITNEEYLELNNGSILKSA